MIVRKDVYTVQVVRGDGVPATKTVTEVECECGYVFDDDGQWVVCPKCRMDLREESE